MNEHAAAPRTDLIRMDGRVGLEITLAEQAEARDTLALVTKHNVRGAAG